ncbi:MAG: TMEM43 family protein [Alphaproteobacteria bacterium]|nr:TMEM43 family protein [Alphaproteobacteria bacterium]
MSDPYTVTTNKSYFQRLGNSFGGIVGGFVLIVACCGLLWWNEGRAVTAEKGLSAATDAAISLTGTTPDAANDGKLVHMTGEAKSVAPVADADLGIAFADALVVSRKVEMYQWKEETSTKTEEKLGGGETTTTTYSYKREWSTSPIDSSKFNAGASAAESRKVGAPLVNPPMTLKSADFEAADATLGGYKLKPALLGQLSGDATPKPIAEPSGWTPTAQGYYAGEGMPEEPKIGDMRVTYTYLASPQTVSVLARQQGPGLEPWRAPNGYEIYRLSLGDKTAAMMIEDQQSAENMMTWILRGAGIVGLCMGFGLILAPLRAIANVVPFIANIVGGGISVIAFALGVPLGLIVIALAWVVYRPLIGIALLVVAGGIIYWFGWGRKRKPAPAAA